MECVRWLFVVAVSLLCYGECYGTPLNICTANITESNNGSLVLLYNRVSVPDNSSCMHYVWSVPMSNSTAYPTLFAALTTEDETVCTQDCSNYVNYTDFSVNIPGAVESEFSLGIVFTRLTEFLVDSKKAESIDRFNDTLCCHCELEPEDNLCQNYSVNYNSMYLNEANWMWVYFDNNQTFTGILLDPEFGNMTNTRVSIRIAFPTTNSSSGVRLPYFPQTLFNENSSTYDFVVENFPYKLTDASDAEAKNASRLSLEVFIIHGPNSINGSVKSVTSLDDEYTPSMFKTITYTMASGLPAEDGYLQWKPISYQSIGRKSTESQAVNIFYTAGDMYCDTMTIPSGLANMIFGNSSSNVTRWFAVFGTTGDQTYFNSGYLTWTSVIGFGTVPTDVISQVVIITIIVGLGIPGALVLLGAVYVFIKNKPWQAVKKLGNKVRGTQQGYTKLN